MHNINISKTKKALLIVHQRRSEPGEIGKKLIERGFKLDIKRPPIGDKLPESMDDYDLSIIFGGPMSINDLNHKFIKYEIDWINIALQSGKPFLGICLGAQMLAKNLGGLVKRCNDKSCEIGFFDINPTKDGQVLFKEQKTFFQWHNEGFTVPKECTILAEGNKFHQQAFRYKNSFGLQFHPEVNLNLHLKWLYYVSISRPKSLKTKGAQNLLMQLFLRAKHNKKIKNWLDNFLDNYLFKKNNY